MEGWGLCNSDLWHQGGHTQFHEWNKSVNNYLSKIWLRPVNSPRQIIILKTYYKNWHATIFLLLAALLKMLNGFVGFVYHRPALHTIDMCCAPPTCHGAQGGSMSVRSGGCPNIPCVWVYETYVMLCALLGCSSCYLPGPKEKILPPFWS